MLLSVAYQTQWCTHWQSAKCFVDFSQFSSAYSLLLDMLLAPSHSVRILLLNEHLFIERNKFNGILYQHVSQNRLRFKCALWNECVIMIWYFFNKANNNNNNKMKKKCGAVNLRDDWYRSSLFTKTLPGCSHPCTSVLGVQCVGSVLFFFFVVVVHSTQCSHSSESINQLRSARVCMCACVYAVERIVDDGTHYLPPCQFLIFNVFTTTDNILYYIQWHPVPLPTIIVPSTIPIFVLNTPIPCIGIDSVLRQLNIQLSQTVYGFRRAANRLQSASVQVCLCAQCVSAILTHSCTLCANQFDASRFRRNANQHCLFMQWASCGKSGEPEVIVAFQTKWKMKILVSSSRSHLKCDRCCYVAI